MREVAATADGGSKLSPYTTVRAWNKCCIDKENEMMKEYKLNTRFLICLVLLLGVAALAVKVIYMMLTGQVRDENGQVLTGGIEKLLPVLIALVISTYVFSAVIMLRQYIRFSGSAFELTDDGIENTMTCINLFAVILVLPVRCIPWEAVKRVRREADHYVAEIDTSQLKVNFLSKLILKSSGYHFCNKFTKENVTESELSRFRERSETSTEF